MKLKIGVFVLALILLVSIGFYSGFAVFSATSNKNLTNVGPVAITFQCNDGIDNDNDTLIDYPNDPQCSDTRDNHEAKRSSCVGQNCTLYEGAGESVDVFSAITTIEFVSSMETKLKVGGEITNSLSRGESQLLNSGVLITISDIMYSSKPTGISSVIFIYSTNGTNGTYQCSDLIDNDNDMLTDFPADPGCDSFIDDDEWNNDTNQTHQCSDLIDNDMDGVIDYPSDPECSYPEDDFEAQRSYCSGQTCNLFMGHGEYLFVLWFPTEISSIGSNYIKLNVGGERTRDLSKGESQILDLGVSITISDIYYNHNDWAKSRVIFTYDYNNTNSTCGNNITEPTEECDDGNLINGDGCDQFCRIENGTCYDTDGGLNYRAMGKIYYNWEYFNQDACSDSASWDLTEFYCNGDGTPPSFVKRNCTLGCSNAACIEPCTDTEEPRDIFSKGTVTYMGNDYTETCYSQDKVSENWCNGDNYTELPAVNCPTSFFCSDGACVYNDSGTGSAYQCSDLIDNDNDTLIDYPADPGCDSYHDNDEWNDNSTNKSSGEKGGESGDEDEDGAVKGITIREDSIQIDYIGGLKRFEMEIYDKDPLADDILGKFHIDLREGVQTIAFDSLDLDFSGAADFFEGNRLEVYAQLGEYQSEIFSLNLV
jgi:cysteine-rich repeat protein